MKVIIIKPFMNPYVAEIKGDLESMQEIIGGYIEAVYPFDDPEIALVCNEEGKICGLPLNRFLFDEDGNLLDMIAGTFFLCSAPLDSENFKSMPDNLIQKYLDKFSARGVKL